LWVYNVHLHFLCGVLFMGACMTGVRSDLGGEHSSREAELHRWKQTGQGKRKRVKRSQMQHGTTKKKKKGAKNTKKKKTKKKNKQKKKKNTLTHRTVVRLSGKRMWSCSPGLFVISGSIMAAASLGAPKLS